MKKKIHPIWWLVGFSLFIGVSNHLLEDKSAAKGPITQAEYETAIADSITELTEIDAYGDMSWRPRYESAVMSLKANCSEKLSELIRLHEDEMYRTGDGDAQFSMLNELEDTVYLLEKVQQRPTTCAPLVSESSWE